MISISSALRHCIYAKTQTIQLVLHVHRNHYPNINYFASWTRTCNSPMFVHMRNRLMIISPSFSSSSSSHLNLNLHMCWTCSILLLLNASFRGGCMKFKEIKIVQLNGKCEFSFFTSQSLSRPPCVCVLFTIIQREAQHILYLHRRQSAFSFVFGLSCHGFGVVGVDATHVCISCENNIFTFFVETTMNGVAMHLPWGERGGERDKNSQLRLSVSRTLCLSRVGRS